MRTFGYTSDVTDEVLLQSFRLRFRPGYQGPLDTSDMALLGELAARFPVDDGPFAA
jgi:N-acetylmuramoyl-L-alanine amidase